jgi:hypothetical protein
MRIRLALAVLLLPLLLLLSPKSILSADKSPDLAQVTNVLETYKKAIETSSFKLMAGCVPPPMDKLNISNENMHKAFQEFAAQYEKTWAKEKLPGVDLTFFKTHPLSHLSNYRYKNVRVIADTAQADVELTVNGRLEKSIQQLAKVGGRWYVVQKNGQPEFSAKDKEKIQSLSIVIQQFADFVNGVIDKMAAGAINQKDCIDAIQKESMEVEKRRIAINNS